MSQIPLPHTSQQIEHSKWVRTNPLNQAFPLFSRALAQRNGKKLFWSSILWRESWPVSYVVRTWKAFLPSIYLEIREGPSHSLKRLSNWCLIPLTLATKTILKNGKLSLPFPMVHTYLLPFPHLEWWPKPILHCLFRLAYWQENFLVWGSLTQPLAFFLLYTLSTNVTKESMNVIIIQTIPRVTV